MPPPGSVLAPWREGEARPTAPRILGPRRTTDRTPTFRFVSHEVGLHSGAIRFRCATDRRRLHRCRSRYTPTPTLRLGRHTLRAVDPKGRTSRTSVARVSVVRPIPHADQTIHVGESPYNVATGFRSEDGTVGELDPASGTLTRSIAAGADADFLGFSPGSVWVTNYRSVFFWRIDPAMSSRRPSSPRGSPRLAQASSRNGRRGARRGGNGVRLATREEP